MTEKTAKLPPLRVLLVDDHEVVRSGVKALLQATEDIVVTAEAGSVREAVDEADRTRPDVVVMDVRLADGSGIEATREIRARHPKTQVVMLTSFADDEALFASIMAGRLGLRPQAGQGRRAGPGDPHRRQGREPPRPGRHQRRPRPAAQGQAPAEGREAGAPVPPGGADPLARRGRQDEQGDRRRAEPRREDGQELRLQHPVQARGRPASRGRRLPRPPHHHARHPGLAVAPHRARRSGNSSRSAAGRPIPPASKATRIV